MNLRLLLVVAVGSNADIGPLVGPQTEVINLFGQ